jgi:hypothetical protein
MYVAKRVKPEVLLATSFLATKVRAPNDFDQQKLFRVCHYLNHTKHQGIIFSVAASTRIYASIDASHNIHADAKGHSGIILRLGERNAPIFVQSKKQTCVSQSSAQTELIALNEGAMLIMWVRQLLDDLEIFAQLDAPEAIAEQDNMSTMCLANNGYRNTGRTKHLSVKYFYIKERIDAKDISLVHVPTGEMTSDLLTKPVCGSPFAHLRHKLLNLPDLLRTIVLAVSARPPPEHHCLPVSACSIIQDILEYHVCRGVLDNNPLPEHTTVPPDED